MSEWIKKSPEKEGIPSLWLTNMMNRWESQLCHVHGYMILRNGNLIAEAYKYPYTAESVRTLHSVSKTVTSIAVGLAVSEGYLTVNDKVLSFFPDYKPCGQSAEYLSELTLAHLLTMSTGQANDNIDSIFTPGEPAWKAFLDTEITDRPGSRFVYNSGATYMLSKILTIATGEKMLDYLQPRLFQPLHITDADWDEIDGATTGGWGCILSLSDLAKIGQLLLQKGKWEGRQIIPEEWVLEMSANHIASDENNVFADWREGYCYQMWRCSREGCFRADGAFGQYILVLPPKNMVAAIWCEDAFSQDMLDSFWEEVYDKADERIYGTDGNAREIYLKKCLEWASPFRIKPTCSCLEELSNHKIYQNCQGDFPASSLCFSFTGQGHLKLHLERAGEISEICANNTDLYFGEARMNFEIASFIRFGKKRNAPVKYAAVYQWLSDHALKIHIYWLNTAHTTDINCIFGADRVAAVFSASYAKYLADAHSTPGLIIADQWFMGIDKEFF